MNLIIPEKNYISSDNQTCQSKREQLSFPAAHKILTAMDFLVKEMKAIVRDRVIIALSIL